MADERAPPAKGSPPPRDDDSVPAHRVVWDHGPLGPPTIPPAARTQSEPPPAVMARGTIRMVRPNLSALAPGGPLSERPVDSVVEMAPTTQRVIAAAPAAVQAPAEESTALMVTASMQVAAPPGPAPAIAPIARPATGSARAPARPIDPRLVLLTDPDSARAAGFRRLRDNLLAKGLPRVLAVSSPAKNDGKTTCAMNLALSLAEHSPARVLLLDANFFAPSFATVFSIDERTPRAVADAPWLAPYQLAELTPYLHVAAMVLPRGAPLPRFDKQRFDMLIDRLCRVGYDHIIVDAPALEGSPMVGQLLGGVDGVLLAVRSGRTTARALRRAVDEIPGGKGLGVTLMDAEPSV